MQQTILTERLTLAPLQETDQAFIRELVNTEGWLTFIGNRNIHSDADAVAYIQRINTNPNVQYWVARRKEDDSPLGIITFIKRDYLEHHDIGFAFLPAAGGQGYAQEAARAVLHHLIQQGSHTHILATTIPSNVSSIRLLEKLGLQYEKEIQAGKDTLHVYAAEAGQLAMR